MRIKSLIILMIVFLVFQGNIFAQSQHEIRVALSKKFVTDMGEGKLTNEEIMEKYVEHAYYFKVDTIRQKADEFIDLLRSNQPVPIAVFRYTGNEDKFMVNDVHPIGAPPYPRKLKFSLSSPDFEAREIDLNDLYVVQIDVKVKPNAKKEYHQFILFNDRNKIVSFITWGVGDHATFLQF